MGEVGQGKSTSKAKEGGKDAAGFNFGTGNTGSKFGTAFSTQPIQVQCDFKNLKVLSSGFSLTRGVLEGSKQQPGKGCQVLLFLLYKPGEP